MRMVDIRYELLTDSIHREELIETHANAGRQWVSTAVANGFIRMKFARFEEKKILADDPYDWNSHE